MVRKLLVGVTEVPGLTGRSGPFPAGMLSYDLKALKKTDRGSNSMVESQPSKLLVAGSIPVSRSRFIPTTRSAIGYV
jgi:hypothetical protein